MAIECPYCRHILIKERPSPNIDVLHRIEEMGDEEAISTLISWLYTSHGSKRKFPGRIQQMFFVTMTLQKRWGEYLEKSNKNTN